MTTPLVLSDDTVLLLGKFADALDQQRPDAEMRDEIRRARALVFAEQLYGPTEKAFDTEQDLLDAAPAVRPGITRGEYAALLRLVARGVSAG
ncbi:hypothetical protein ACFUIV_21230 [Streptomyces anulatus]|uniref:hypothetical protein n=1 Tax=Streptomyces anulatus TaxID=1892 RepID=UPI003638D447